MTTRGYIKNGEWKPHKQEKKTPNVMRPEGTFGTFNQGVYIPHRHTGPVRRWREDLSGCNSIQKKKYKPECAKTPEEKNLRRERIDTLVREYERMKQRERSKFLRKIHERTTEEWWITSHYYVDRPIIQNQPNGIKVLGEIRYSKTPIRGSHRQNLQQSFSYQNLRNMKMNKIPNSRSELSRILQIFESKISFHYNQRLFFEKMKRIDEFMKEITKSILINDRLFDLLGNDELVNIFGDKIYHFLTENGILTQKLLNQYQELLAINGDENLKIKVKDMWYISYQSRIEILFAILSIPMDHVETFIYNVENMLKLELSMRVYQYIYYSNEYLKEEYIPPPDKTREMMIEIAFEYVYYHYLNFYLDFCKMFLGCVDKPLPENPIIIGKGALGSVIEIEPGIVEKMLSSDRIERSIFEFFKNICLYEEFSEYIAEPVLFTIGSNLLYIKMKKIDGQTLFDYIVSNKKFINLSNEDKYKIIKEISIKCSNILKKMQDTSDFIHYDFNLRNIIIDDNINIYLLDFDKSLFKINNIYIFTFHQMLNINILKDNEFKKSIDLFRYISKFFTLLDDLKSYKEGYKKKNNEEIKDFINKTITNYVLIMISNIFFGVNDINIGVRIFKITGKYSWPTILSIYKKERYKVCKLLNRVLISGNIPLYIRNFIPNYFNMKWY